MHRTLALALVLLAASIALAPAPAHAAEDADPGLAYAATVPGSAAFAMRVNATGPFTVDLQGAPPQGASQRSVGVWLIYEDKDLQIGLAHTRHGSEDRLVAHGPLVTGSGAQAGVPFDVPVEATTDAESAGACPLVCLTVGPLDPVPDVLVVWVGDVAESRLEVRGDVTVDVNVGDAVVLGDPELEDGVNAEVQRANYVRAGPWKTHYVGAKVMKDAAVDVDVEDRLFGFWGANDFKFACERTTFPVVFGGSCYWFHYTFWDCENLIGPECGPAHISWDGPGEALEGRNTFAFHGQPAGEYTFRVDHKVDAWGPVILQRTPPELPGGGQWEMVILGENQSYLTIADVRVP